MAASNKCTVFIGSFASSRNEYRLSLPEASCFLTELLKEDYEIVDSPPPVGKDVNDFLMSYLGLSRQKPVRERSDIR